MRSNYDKEVSVMGYTMMMGVRGSGENKYYGAQINNTKAKEKNRFALDMTPNAPNLLIDEDADKYTIEVHVTGIGNLTLEEFPEYLEAVQRAFLTAQRLQDELNNFIENN